ncbi:MAG: hypothetical protein M1475_08430 [Actinobacteria bacterium]|nr:hypothetical protein [Actinomycetota bacterium]
MIAIIRKTKSARATSAKTTQKHTINQPKPNAAATAACSFCAIKIGNLYKRS